jgi:hypothetical protein
MVEGALPAMLSKFQVRSANKAYRLIVETRQRILSFEVAEPTQLTLERRTQVSSFCALIQPLQSSSIRAPDVALTILDLSDRKLPPILAQACVDLGSIPDCVTLAMAIK